MVCKSSIRYGVEVWGLKEGWEEIDKAHTYFGKNNNYGISYDIPCQLSH
jgi:hypothetical protein